MASKPVTITIDMPDLKRTLRAYNRLGKDAQKDLRDEAGKVAEWMAAGTRGAADTRQARLAAKTIKVKRDRVPVIVAGGSRKVRRGVSAGDVFFGSEFGGRRRTTTQQFRRHRGTKGYWFYPWIRRNRKKMLARYDQVLTKMTYKWTSRV